jgi:hypothetical protein
MSEDSLKEKPKYSENKNGRDLEETHIKEYEAGNTRYVIITQKERADNDVKLNPMQKLLRVGEGFAAGILSGGFALWSVGRFAKYKLTGTLTIPNSGSIYGDLSQGQIITIDKLNFKVISDSTSSITIQQILPNGALGQAATVGDNPGSEILTVHNGIVTSVQQLTSNLNDIVVHAGNGTYQYITMSGMLQNSAGNMGIYATVIKDHLSITQNWVAQALSSLPHQIEFIVALGVVGSVMGLVSGLYRLQRRGGKEDSD